MAREAEAVSGVQPSRRAAGTVDLPPPSGALSCRAYSAIPSVVAVGRFCRSEMSAYITLQVSVVDPAALQNDFTLTIQ